MLMTPAPHPGSEKAEKPEKLSERLRLKNTSTFLRAAKQQE